MKEAIKNRIPIHVDLLPIRDEVYSGVCLKANGAILVLISFDEEIGEFNGFTILRDNEINKYRYWDVEELAEIKNNNLEQFLNILPLEKMNTFQSCLEILVDKDLISIFTKEDDDTFFLGRIISLTSKTVNLKLLDANANWIDNKKLKIEGLNYIGFDSKYEVELIKTLHNKS